ncbi:MauE/DoxX family redox-associated membrane protein [Actinomycetes bacterium KLBMP 9797]
MPYLLLFARCLIGLTFALSAWSKLRGGREFRAFAASLRDMRVLPARLVGPVAGTVAVAEAAVPVLLLPLPAPGLATLGFLLAGALLAAFTVAVVAVLRRGVPASCRCFGGPTAAPFRRHHVVRNLALIAVAAAGVYAAVADTPAGAAVALAVPPAAVAALIVARLDDLVALFTPTPP